MKEGITDMTEQTKKPQISLIISVYNTQLYIRECLDSVLGQTFTDWELIIIDDGSTDGSPAIIDEYARHDKRLRVVHKQNSGKPDSCNLAIKMIRGAYVGFLDSDDWIEPVYLETLYAAIQTPGVDFSSCGYLNEFRNHTSYDPVCTQTTLLTSCQTIKRIYLRKLYGYLHGRLFRRTLLQEPIPQLRRYEDMAVVHKWLSHAEGVILCPECLYHYRQRASSIMNSEGDRMVGMIPLFSSYYYYIKEQRLLNEDENKAIALRNYIRIAKNIARNISTDTEVFVLLNMIRREVLKLMPFPKRYLNPKSKRRLTYLIYSVKFFTFYLRFGRFFVLSRRKDAPKYEFFV